MNEVLTRHDPRALAILDADRNAKTSYAELTAEVTRSAERLQRAVGRDLVFHIATNTPGSIVLYLAGLEAGCPLVLLASPACGRLGKLLATYEPAAVTAPADSAPPADWGSGIDLPADGYRLYLRRRPGPVDLHPALALLLTTSGSTGHPKLVRLTRDNLSANARSIARYLAIQPGDRSIQSLPMHYAYGLSLVNSHLIAGATTVLTRQPFFQPAFWRIVEETRCTSFAGVPYLYETLDRLRFEPARYPSLRTMTQAGGALRVDLVRRLHRDAVAAGRRFVVMYGQTEATARIAYVPFERLGDKIGSIGIPIPGGHLSLAPLEDSDRQELVYAGPNVMMGYATSSRDLGTGDKLGGTLRTGDIASVDGDGFYYLQGRLTRFTKLSGQRVDLDDVERQLETTYPIHAAAVERDGQLRVYGVARDTLAADRLKVYVARTLRVPPTLITVDFISEIPLTASGKKDYRALCTR